MPTKNQTRDFVRKFRIEHDNRIAESLDNLEYELPVAGASTLGGVKVGSGLSMNGESICAETYTLPTASNTVKGGVKVGAGLTISNESLSVDTDAVSAAVTLPTASATTKGGVKIGTGCVMRSDSLCAMSGNVLVLPAIENAEPLLVPQVASIQGGLWGDYIDEIPHLRMRYGDYFYNFAYDSATQAGSAAAATLDVNQGQQYVLGTASVSAQGGLWYTVGSDSCPDLCVHLGNVNFGITHDTQTFVGDYSGLVNWVPCDTTPYADLCAASSPWVSVNGEPSVVSDSTAFKGKCLKCETNQSIKIAGIFNDQKNAFECWVKCDTTTATRPLTYKWTSAQTVHFIEINKNTNGTQTIKKKKSGTTAVDWSCTVPGGWTHLAFTNNRDELLHRFYVNGQQKYSSTLGASPSAMNVTVGNNYTLSGGVCYIDEIRIWSDTHWTTTFTPPVASDYVYP